MSPARRYDDSDYLKILLDPLATCKHYKPKFGHGAGLSLAEFQSLYQADPFYTWFGLDSPLLYAAHRAGGGMTSVYRQIGIGCQRLIQRIFMDTLGLSTEEASWSYETTRRDGRRQVLSLDGRIPTSAIRDKDQRDLLTRWLRSACSATETSSEIKRVIKGSVFEIRQGYKSKDSKRQNADLANAATAYAEAYLPALLLLSTQIDDDLADRYQSARWLILRGTLTGTSTTSTYVFCREVLGYDLAKFFQRHAALLRKEVEIIFKTLLV